VEYVNGAFKKQTNEGMQSLLNAANAFYKLWKPTVTGLNPDFHVRNTFGNTMNTMLHYGLGALDPVKIKGGITVSALANGTAKSADRVVLTAGSESWTAKQALEAMMRYEAGNTFFSTDAADVSRAIDSRLSGELKGGGVAGQMKAMGEKMTAPLTAGTRSERAAEVMGRAAMPIGKVADASATVGNYVEMQGKATAFLNGLEEGMEKGMTREQSEEYAAEMANRYLFNYSDLTSVEKNVFRNIFPFYTWVRKNLPLQMEEFLNNPANYTVAPKYIRNVNQANETDTTNMPEWMQDSMALPIPGASPDEEGRVPMANLSVPQTDVGLLGDIPKNALNMLNPLAKVGIETATNRSLLTGAPLYRNDYEKNGALFNNAVNQFGIVRNARAMMAEPDTANKAVTPTAPGIPFVGRSIAKSYNPEAGARDAMWDYNRQLGNEVQHLKDMYGDVVPDTIDAEKWAALPPEIIQAIKETGVIPPYLKRTRTVTVPVDETPTYSKGYRARYITKTKNQLLEGALSKNGGL
jgi:hypothetical protein